MIAAWMLYTTALGLLIAGATMLAEQLAFQNDSATRRMWAWGLAAAAGLPVVTVLLKDAPVSTDFTGVVEVLSPTAVLVMGGVDTLAVLDGGLVSLWVAASVGLVLWLLAGLLITSRRHKRWVSAHVDGVSVLLAEDVGPAVVGFLRSRIVLPRWALEIGESERRMMLRHEQEHLAARDPRLILFGAAMVVLMPWNLGMWFMAHRLRLAIEVDCDRRVMRAQDMDTRSYAELLLAVGQRRSVGAYGIGFSLGRPFLEERIDRMTLPRTRPRRSTNALMVMGIVGVMCAAWALPQPVRAADVGQEWGLACPLKDSSSQTQALLDASHMNG